MTDRIRFGVGLMAARAGASARRRARLAKPTARSRRAGPAGAHDDFAYRSDRNNQLYLRRDAR